MYEIVFFDLDDTLIDRGATLQCAANRLSARFGANGSISAQNCRDWRRMLMRFRYLAADVSFEELAREFESGLHECVQEKKDARQTVRRLSRRVRVGVISNGRRRIQKAKIRGLGIQNHLAVTVISGETRFRKPDAKIFETALKHAGCTPEEALFVGNEPVADIGGAKAVGMATAWTGRLETYPEGIGKPDHVLENLPQLLELVP